MTYPARARLSRLTALLLLATLAVPRVGIASVTARAVTEARVSVGAIATSSDFKECGGCVASTSNTGTIVEAAGGTSQSDSAAWALAEHGILKTFASEASTGAHGYARATSTATFGDSLTIDAPGRSGQGGTVSMLLLFDFDANVTGQRGAASGRAQLLLDLFVGNRTDSYQRALNFDPDGQSTSQSFDPGNVAVPFSKQILAEVNFVFGQTSSFKATLLAFGTGSFDQRVEIDASHSPYWGGFLSVLDGSGNAVDYSVISSSQTDWSQSFVPAAVPEPSALALLLAGMGVVVARARGSFQAGHRRSFQPA